MRTVSGIAGCEQPSPPFKLELLSTFLPTYLPTYSLFCGTRLGLQIFELMLYNYYKKNFLKYDKNMFV